MSTEISKTKTLTITIEDNLLNILSLVKPSAGRNPDREVKKFRVKVDSFLKKIRKSLFPEQRKESTIGNAAPQQKSKAKNAGDKRGVDETPEVLGIDNLLS